MVETKPVTTAPSTATPPPAQQAFKPVSITNMSEGSRVMYDANGRAVTFGPRETKTIDLTDGTVAYYDGLNKDADGNDKTPDDKTRSWFRLGGGRGKAMEDARARIKEAVEADRKSQELARLAAEKEDQAAAKRVPTKAL